MDSGYVKTFNYFDMSALSTLKAKADDNADNTLKVVAQQLESVFLELVLKSMTEANNSIKSEIFDRDQEEFYQSMFNQQLALSLSKSGGFGLADVIYNQLKPKAGHNDTQAILPNAPLRTTNDNPYLVADKAIVGPNVDVTHLVRDAEVEQNVDEEIHMVQIKAPTLNSIKEFIDTLLPHAKAAASLIGIDPKVLLAQSALETGWGKHILQHEDGASSHNLFGVKADKKWEGNSILAQTLEYAEDKAQQIKATFKSYDNYLESFMDYMNLLKNKRYEKALNNAHDPKAFLTELHKAGYATDPNYVEKIMTIYEKFS
ncbi:MAG: flagellar assembly peptidoglycan hydrolase FlgJ [Proteobacteria bacterium]|nr:flagellar assembly peptidoglycan hydrolase FlgJ [Pseudomonadota bacterium]